MFVEFSRTKKLFVGEVDSYAKARRLSTSANCLIYCTESTDDFESLSKARI